MRSNECLLLRAKRDSARISLLSVHGPVSGSHSENFFAAYAPKAQPDRLIEKLGERYEIAQTDIKKWTVGSPIQGPLDAVQAIRDKRPFEADQVQRVTVRLAPPVATIVDNRDIPDKRELRRRSAVEPVIGHLKSEHRMGRNYLWHRQGDAANAVLAAVGYNFRRLIRWLSLLLSQILAQLTLRLLLVTG